MNFDTKKIAPYNIDPKFWNLGIWNFWVNIMRCNFWVAKIHILVYIDPLVRQSHEKLKLANRRQLWSENHATSCKNFVVKNFTPEMCFVPKFQQNRTNGSKVKSKKPVFSLFLSHLWPWWPLSLGTGQMWVFAYRNAFLLEFWQSDHWFLRNVRSANCLGHTVHSNDESPFFGCLG